MNTIGDRKNLVEMDTFLTSITGMFAYLQLAAVPSMFVIAGQGTNAEIFGLGAMNLLVWISITSFVVSLVAFLLMSRFTFKVGETHAATKTIGLTFKALLRLPIAMGILATVLMLYIGIGAGEKTWIGNAVLCGGFTLVLGFFVVVCCKTGRPLLQPQIQKPKSFF